MLLYVWLVSEGTQALLQGRTAQVDRSNRRDLSLFRLGLELIQRAITFSTPYLTSFFLKSNCRVASFLPSTWGALGTRLRLYSFQPIPQPDFGSCCRVFSPKTRRLSIYVNSTALVK